LENAENPTNALWLASDMLPDARMFNVVLEYDPNVNVRYADNRTALMAAASNASVEGVAALLDRGASLEAEGRADSMRLLAFTFKMACISILTLSLRHVSPAC
jgi:ankyrin repeat protein